MRNEAGADASPEDLHQEITGHVIAYLDERGVAERSRVSLIAEITGLSTMQARRRFAPDGPTWMVEELVKLARHHGETLADVFSDVKNIRTSASLEPCEIEISGSWYGAQARVGEVAHGHRGDELVALRREGQRWRLVRFASVPLGIACHEVFDIGLLPKPTQNVKIAILDDDASLVEAIKDSLTGTGYSAATFTSDEQLNKRFTEFDVFIIDFVLAGGKTASAVIEAIRAVKPKAPIIVLTGHAREAASGEIASLVRSFAVDVQEKPAQMAILESIIESRLGGSR